MTTVNSEAPKFDLQDGTYQLGNHPGFSSHRPFGLIMRSLLTEDNTATYFDFDHPDSDIRLEINGSQVRVYGTTFGGIEAGDEFDPNNSGLFEIDITYNNVEDVAGDDDLHLTSENAKTNTGTIKQLYGEEKTFDLLDEDGNFGYSFRLGDTDGGSYRGYEGTSGWGWLTSASEGSKGDFHFIVKEEITVEPPTPEQPILENGTYQLGNHPDGAAANPLYGLRLDGLLTGDSKDIVTFDFEHPDADVRMEVNDSEIRIYGTAFGGIDTGTEYDPNNSGLFEIDFTYTDVEGVAGDDDFITNDPNTRQSTGTITQLYGEHKTFDLIDESDNFGYSFRLGDGDNDQGHRGFTGASGWGWMQHSSGGKGDWLFAVKEEITGDNGDDNNTNNAPVAVDDSASTTTGKKVGVRVLNNDTDADGDTIRLISATQGENGRVVRNNNGTIGDTSDDRLVYIPNEGFVGEDSFTYRIGDGNGGFDTAEVTVTVEGDTTPTGSTIAEIVAQSGGEFDSNGGDFDILLQAVQAAGLADALNDPNADLTVFAPVDDAFVKLAQDLGFEGTSEEGAFSAIVDKLTELGEGDPIPLLKDILLYHVSPDEKSLEQIKNLETVETLLDGATISPDGNSLIDNDPDLEDPSFIAGATDIDASNGVVQGIDRVLVPLDIPGSTVEPEAPILKDGTYQLANHPDGGAANPLYGLRLDGLLTGDSKDIVTFDFEHPDADVRMDVNGSEIRIYGTAFGGIDTGTEYDPNNSGLFEIDFTYTDVDGVAGDDDFITNDPNTRQSTGTITQLYGEHKTFDLIDESDNFGYSFRLGDEDNDQGHRGFAGTSGWGWMKHSSGGKGDWLFTVKEEATGGNEETGVVGGQIWHDRHVNDGIQDITDLNYEAGGFKGGTVNLYTEAGELVDTTVTGNVGFYEFTDVKAGSYYVEFDVSNDTLTKEKPDGTVQFTRGPEGRTWRYSVVPNAGNDEARDSDVTSGFDSRVAQTTDVFELQAGEINKDIGAALTPLAFDLNGDGVQTVSIEQGVQFDMQVAGYEVSTGWLSGEDAFLTIDNNQNGQIDDLSELFGGANVGDGFAKLETFDSNNDGLVNELDDRFGELLVWQDANENGNTDSGELVSILDAGITNMATDYTDVFRTDAQGNIHGEHSSAELNGNTIDMVDVYFQVGV